MPADTIAAVATSNGRGGIGIVKISGDKSVPIAAALFRPKGRSPAGVLESRTTPVSRVEYFESHRFYYGHICDPATGRLIDEALMVVMRGPRSYTCEDVAEIHAHGGPLALRTILDLVVGQGARIAVPGEFTQRAFLNGRIDLTQAEAVMDLIEAKSLRALEAAASQLEGRLQVRLAATRNRLIDLLARVEAAIDFPEDMDEILNPLLLAAEVEDSVVRPLQQLIVLYDETHILRDGLRVAVVGKPNTGKSSLLNRMVQKDRAIVTPVPGTTRDVVEETVSLQGIPVTFCDTAGLHDTSDPVEVIGVKKTREQIASCDLVVFMVEAHQPFSDQDLAILRQVEKRPYIIALNKIDLVNGQPDSDVLPDGLLKRPVARISALHGHGMGALKEMILALGGANGSLDVHPAVIPNLRQKRLLDDALSAAGELARGLRGGDSPELTALYAREAIDRLGEILGEIVKPDILERIFDRFCIGK